MTALAQASPLTPGWVRDRSFDLVFLVAVPALALLAGALVVAEPRLFAPILLLDVWLLGQHHVVSTWTRLTFDRESFARHRFLALGLPVIVALCVVAIAAVAGLWPLTSIYLYWQWFHYTRQSYGVARIYQRKAGGGLASHDLLERLAFYALPLWGILYRSHQAPERFLGQELVVLPVPALVVDVAGAVALVGLLGWIGLAALRWRQGRLPAAYALYVLTHFSIFGASYLCIENIDHGWLVVNVWHNAQYILFVWMFNTRRFEGREEPSAPLLSHLCQPGNLPLYLAVCLGISTLLYLSIDLAVASAAVALVVYQTINFHHYLVDGLIWKVRRGRVPATLGIPAARARPSEAAP